MTSVGPKRHNASGSHLMSKTLRALVFLAAAVAILGGLDAWRRYTGTPEYLLREGREAVRRGDSRAAEEAAARLDAAGHADHARLLLGELYFRRRGYARALQEFNKIEDRGDLRREAAAQSGQCLLRLGNAAEAARCFEFVLS